MGDAGAEERQFFLEQELDLVRLKYTYKFESEFREPCDKWLESIEDKCNEILVNYNKKEDKALTVAFEPRRSDC
jgi:hypothetical protein